MQFSVGVEYSLHCLLYLVGKDENRSIGIKDLAAYQGVSESYLSKFFTKLKKSGIVSSVPGAKGGYKLAKEASQITFWDVVEAIEGSDPMFNCSEVRQNELLLDKSNLPDSHTKCPCLIHIVMLEAEDQMRNYLRSKTLQWLSDEVSDKVDASHLLKTQEWFDRNLK